ncbi:MAG: DEAD/DEAH box helicase, partial [Janthinobacterium lividum]
VLADDMGLGKTIQVLALLLHEREEGTVAGPTLLVAPTSLLTNWAREAQRFAPGLRVLVHHGRERKALLDLPAVDLVVTSYGIALRDIEDLRAIHWHRLVLDEAHYVKNSSGRQASAIRTIAADRRLALTGTPVENRLLELRGILDAVNPGVLGSEDSFRKRFSTPIEQYRDPIALSRLQLVTRPFILRREKTDRSIIDDLPDKIEQVVPVTLTSEQAALYRARVNHLLEMLPTLSLMQRRAMVLATLTQLKQICNHPAHYLGDGSPLLRRGGHRSGKLAVLDDLVTAALDGGEQMLLFTQFTAFGEMLLPHLAGRFGLEVPFLQGKTPRRRRDEMVAGFQAGQTPLLMLSLRAGGTGLNLTAASQVVHIDRWWNPSVENQATDRAYRIGQQRVVNVHKMMAIGTVEEKIDALIQGKSELAQLAVSAGENWVTELGGDALRELLTLDTEVP